MKVSFRSMAAALLVCIFQGAANGSLFLPPATYAAGADPFFLIAGDFNGDGVPDLVVANYYSTSPEGTITILIGRGDGTFEPAKQYSSGGYEPNGLALGDFNGDGHLDIAVSNQGSSISDGNVSVLLGNGDGSFRGAVSYAVGSLPFAVAAGDFNQDGHFDLAVAAGSGVDVLLGKGDGTFQPAVEYVTGIASTAIVVVDFNGDGHPDMAVANENSDDVSILLGKGDGSFSTAVNYPAGSGPADLKAADFNSDGKLDLVAANAASSFGTTVTVLLGNGDGTFGAPTSFPAGNEPISVAVADFDGDGKLDLAVADVAASGGEGAVSVLLGNGDGTFQPALEYNVGTSPDAVLAQDLNGDGRPDLVAANPTPATISVFLDAEASCALAPDISHVFADPNRISGDEHKMVPVTINYDAVSECGGTLSCKLSVASNFGGRHNWTVIDAHHVRLKADEGECKGDWRHGKEESRKERCRPVYTITVRCTDTRGNSASRRTTVEVERECHR